MKEAESLQSPSASSLRSNALSSSSSGGSSFRELLSASELSSACGRICRENRSQISQSGGQTSDVILTRQLSTKLDKLDLIPREQDRVSVIARTPSRSPQTSTPSNSPQPPPVPPRTCQSLGPIVPPRSRSHSPSCSDISSINGDPFSDGENSGIERSVIVRPPPKVKQTPSLGQETPFRIPLIQTTRTMEASERDVKRKYNQIEFRMRTFVSESLTEGHLQTFDAKMDGFEALLEDFVLSVEDLCFDYKTEMGPVKEKYWTDLVVTTESKARTYRSSMMKKVSEVRTNHGTRENSAEERYQDQSLQLKRQELQIQERALAVKEKESADKLSETLREAGTKKSAAMTKAKNKCDAIFEDCDLLSDKIALGDMKEASDLVIGRAMRDSKVWKEELDKVIDMKRSFEDIVAVNELSEEDTRLYEVTILLDRLTDEVREAIDTVKGEDDSRELYTLDSAKTETVKLPTFEGREDEDFAKFKELVEKAFVQNRVT